MVTFSGLNNFVSVKKVSNELNLSPLNQDFDEVELLVHVQQHQELGDHNLKSVWRKNDLQDVFVCLFWQFPI